MATGIDSVEATGTHEVVIHLTAPSDSIFDLLDLTPVVDQDTWADIADGKVVVGTGPFTWESWTAGAPISLTANPDYWGDGPYLDGVDVSIIGDSTAMQSSLRAGAIDVAIGMAQSDVRLLSEDDAFTLAQAGGVFYPLGFDVTQPPFDTPQARAAIGYAIDRERISDQVFGGDSAITDLWWTPDSPGYPDGLSAHFSYDPDRARTLLANAGVAGASLTITYANMPTMKSLFEVIQNNLTEVGLEVKAEALDVTDYDKRQVEGTLGQSFLLLHGMVGFSSATIIDAMPAIREGNPSKFANQEYDVLKTAVREADGDLRDDALTALSAYMLDESFSHIVAVAPQYHVHSSALTGARVVSLGSMVLTDAVLGG